MDRVETPSSVCRFAVARGDITPPVGIYHRMWGAAVHDRAAGVHRPLTATVMIFQSPAAAANPAPDTRQVLVALDHCLLGERELDLIYKAAESAAGVQRESVAVVFSHTHAAGLMSFDRVALPGGQLIPDYLASVSKCVAELISQAASRLEEATISYAVGRCNLAADRDYWDEQQQAVVCGMNPEGEADDTVLIARITSTQDQLLATVVNYACHPTTLAWDNQLISPDYPGAMRELVEEATAAPCVFLQGASGDLGPRDGFVGDVEVADRNGRQLGYAVLSALASLSEPRTLMQYAGPVISGATIGTWKHVPISHERDKRLRVWETRRWQLMLPYRADLPRREVVERERQRLQSEEQQALAAGDADRARDRRALIERQTRLLSRLAALPDGPAYPYQIALWKMGDAFWLAVQGEPYNLLQQAVRQRFPGIPIVVAVLAGAWGPSYLPPAELYGRGIYQESIAVVAPGSLEKLIDEIAAAIECLVAG